MIGTAGFRRVRLYRQAFEHVNCGHGRGQLIRLSRGFRGNALRGGDGIGRLAGQAALNGHQRNL